MPSAAMLSLMNRARVRLPGALDNAIQQEMSATFDELLTTAPLWFEDIDVPVVPGTTEYTLTPTAGAIVRLLYMKNDDVTFAGTQMEVIPVLTLPIEPGEPATWQARVQLKNNAVDGGYPVVPDWIVERYEVQILDGVLGRMMSQIAKPYTSSQTAAVHYRMFRSFTQRAKNEARKSHLYGAQRWGFPQTFNRVR
jgi:hypothetical protein